MKRSILLLFSIALVLFLVGCSSQTTVKYQCTDGTFVDSANLCSSVNCKIDCPQLDCANCPPKIEYQTKEVEKPVYVDKQIYKYQCFDGTSANSIIECKYTDTSSITKVGNCDDNSELRKMDIWFNDPENIRDFVFEDIVNVWYPGENEGKVFGIPLFLKNNGCKKIEPSVNMYLYNGDNLVYKIENQGITFLSGFIYASNPDWMNTEQDLFYPNDWSFTYAFLNENDGAFKRNGIKINSLGEYRLRVIIKDKISGNVAGSKEIKLTIKSV